jgi:hypothetical protein
MGATEAAAGGSASSLPIVEAKSLLYAMQQAAARCSAEVFLLKQEVIASCSAPSRCCVQRTSLPKVEATKSLL